MSEMNELEMQLRSWVPRRPAAKLERQLFALADAAPRSVRTPDATFHWLAPLTACLVLMVVLFSQHSSPAISGAGNTTPMVAMILSNQSAAAYLPGSFQRAQNGIRNRTFEWTNGSGSTSSIRSLSFWTRGNR